MDDAAWPIPLAELYARYEFYEHTDLANHPAVVYIPYSPSSSPTTCWQPVAKLNSKPSFQLYGEYSITLV